MKETVEKYCKECMRDFAENETVFYTWYENGCFCYECRDLMNTRVTPSYLDWQPRIVQQTNKRTMLTLSEINLLEASVTVLLNDERHKGEIKDKLEYDYLPVLVKLRDMAKEIIYNERI